MTSDLDFQGINVTKTVFRAVDFLAWQRSKQLDLRPPFQRGSVWKVKARSYLIDSIIRGYPIPTIFIQDRTDSRTHVPVRQVVDGQQRLRTLLAYIDPSSIPDLSDEEHFTIDKSHNAELAGRPFGDLPREVQSRILGFEFSVHILPSYTPQFVLLELFARMNSSGVRLNNQELRNAKFFGECKQLCYAFSYQNVERWLGWGVFNSGQLARMSEVELTSELVMSMFYGLGRKSQNEIDKFYARFDDEMPYAEKAQEHLYEVFDLIDRVFAPRRGPNLTGCPLLAPYAGVAWFYALFVILHELLYGSQTLQKSTARPRRVNLAEVRSLLKERAERVLADDTQLDPSLLKALRGAATDKSSRQARYEFLRDGGIL